MSDRLPEYLVKCDRKVSLSGIRHGNPVEMTGGPAKWINIPAHYENNGRRMQLNIASPRQTIWGAKPKYRDDGNIKGYFIRFPLTSRDTVKTPTAEESIFESYIEEIAEQAYSHICGLAKLGKKELAKFGIPEAFIRNFIAQAEESMNEKDRDSLLKPWKLMGASVDPNSKGPGQKPKFIPDPDKPWVAIFNVSSNGKGEVFARLNAPREFKQMTGRECSFLTDIVEKPIQARIRISYDGIFLGSHGSDKTWCASLKFRVHEIGFSPLGKRQTVQLLDADENQMPNDYEDTQTTSKFSMGDEGDDVDAESSEGDEPLFKPTTITQPPVAVPARANTPPREDESEKKDRKHKVKKKERKNKHVEDDS